MLEIVQPAIITISDTSLSSSDSSDASVRATSPTRYVSITPPGSPTRYVDVTPVSSRDYPRTSTPISSESSSSTNSTSTNSSIVSSPSRSYNVSDLIEQIYYSSSDNDII